MQQRPSIAAVLGIGFLAAFSVFITWRAKSLESAILQHSRVPALTGKPAPAFTLSSLDGGKVSLADYHGKQKLVVSFWASWCGPCRLELPVLRAFYERYHKSNAKFELLAISIDDDTQAAESFAASAKLPFPVLLDPRNQAADAYGVEAIPMLFVIDENGKVVYGQTGFDSALEFQLMHFLGIPLPGEKGGAAGGDSGH